MKNEALRCHEESEKLDFFNNNKNLITNYEKEVFHMWNDKGDNFSSLDLYGKIFKLSKNLGESEIYNLENETGEGTISVYKVFSGIELIYNDIHMEYCSQNPNIMKNAIEINHCKEGRYECSYGNGGCCYISPGDLSIGSLMKKKTFSNFPLSHYHGITIILKLEEISEELSSILEVLSIDLKHIKSYICDNNRYCVMRANESIEHIFSELYYVREQRKAGYMKIKVLELLLFLSDLNTKKEVVEVKYYSNKQVKMAKEIKKFIINDISKHYTISELAKKFNVSASTLKTCFKGVYASNIYSYLKNYRLQVAQRLLLESNNTITEIAENIGYENPNKFTSAFKKEYGISPSDYRKGILLDRKLFIRSGEK